MIQYYLALSFLLFSFVPAIAFGSSQTDYQKCMWELLEKASAEMTVGEIRSKCSTIGDNTAKADELTLPEEVEAPVNRRIRLERENVLKPFTLIPHRPNYVLLYAHNFNGYNNEEVGDGVSTQLAKYDSTETQFQLSVKTPLFIDLFDRDINVWGGFTVSSFFQLYDRAGSYPFRETNYGPEIWLQTPSDLEIFGFKNIENNFGFIHESNGGEGQLSRGWNRIYGDFIFSKDNLTLSLKPWIRILRDNQSNINSDITKYLGHGEIRLIYAKDDHTFSFMSRNNLESSFSRGAVELSWSFPIFNYPYLKGYLQVFSGYGESLIDYNNYVNKIGIGVSLSDYL